MSFESSIGARTKKPSFESSMGARSKTPEKEPAPEALAFGESKLKGSLITERNIRANLAYLSSLAALAKEAGSYRNLLSGEAKISKPLDKQLHINSTRMLHEAGLLDDSVISFGGALKGPDYAKLKTEKPNERYKFYSSFDLTSPEKLQIGKQWFAEVIQKASEAGLSLTAKSFDHAYDSLNLYTWHPEGLAKILQELYPKYVEAGLYHETPHFFQGRLEGIDPNHVGSYKNP